MFAAPGYRERSAVRWTTMPPALRRTGVRTAWADANRGGEAIDSFLEGPCFDADGSLVVVDIPHGRLLRIDPAGAWSTLCEYDGWPNGCKRLADGTLLVADYRRGLVSVDPLRGTVSDRLAHHHSEGFKGLNDLHVGADCSVWFSDQGQTGLHDPSGRVYRLWPNGQLQVVLNNVPSPNGLALSPDGRALFVAVTRDASVWRGAVMADGSIGKVGRFVSFFGATGPDGLAFDALGRLWVAHPSGESVWIVAASGEIEGRVRLAAGAFPTNLAFFPDGRRAAITASGEGAVYVCDVA